MSSQSEPAREAGAVAEPGVEAGGRSAFGEPGPAPSGAGPGAFPDEALVAEEVDTDLADSAAVTDSVLGTLAEDAEEAPAALPPPDPFELLAQERDDYRDALIRMQADFENYKKRVFKQQEEQRDRATEVLVEKLLPVLDTADLALAHGGGEDVKQLGAALSAALEKEGLERIDPQGGPFDPTLHDAVAHEPGDGGIQEVAEVMRAGYRWKGRVIRPAMVRVRG
jgi:molecular chaperone GrpE